MAADLHVIVACPEKGDRDAHERIGLFHYLAHRYDADWPYVKKLGSYPIGRHRCDHCGGMVYNNALLTPQKIKELAKMCKVVVKIRSWKPAEKCNKKKGPKVMPVVMYKSLEEAAIGGNGI